MPPVARSWAAARSAVLPGARPPTSRPPTFSSSARRQISSMRAVLFGLDVAQQRMPFDEVVARTQFAEQLGSTGCGGSTTSCRCTGKVRANASTAMTTLAALSAHTSSVRLGLLVTGVTYRHPSIFATQAMTIDHASHGRLNLAARSGVVRPGTRAARVGFPSVGERFDLLEDTLEIVTRLFTGERVSYDGRRVSLDGAQLRPLPVQRPRPPIWIGGRGRDGRFRWSPGSPTGGTPRRGRTIRSCRRGWTGWPRRPAAIPRRSGVPYRCRCPSRGTRSSASSSARRVGLHVPHLRLARRGGRPGREFAATVMPAYR